MGSLKSPRHLAAVLVALGVAFAFASDRAAGAASLSATVRGPATIQSNDFGFFTLTITNGGNATAHSVAFSVGFLDYPANEAGGGVSACPVAGSRSGNYATATLGDIAAGASVSCTFAFSSLTGPATLHHSWEVSSTDAGAPSGEYDVTIDAGGAPPGVPFNDDRANAAVLASSNVLAANGMGSLTERTDAATLEVGEPSHAGDAGGSSVWFSWTPGFTGTAQVNTDNSEFDTLLDVRDPSTNVVLASNDDGTATSSSSVTCFAATKGSPVLIAGDGYLGASGRLKLNYGPDPATAPCPGTPPVVTGLAGADETAPLVGDTLSGTDGGWFDNSGATVTYQWHRCIESDCSTISGATSSTYQVQERDIGTTLRLEVVETTAGGTTRNLSDPSGVARQVAVTHENGRIFWASNRGAGLDWEIYSQFVDGSSFHEVSNHVGFDSEPSATMDGTTVAWVQGSNDLVVAAADGGGFADLQTTGRFPTFSPDFGSRIAFAASDGIHVTNGLVDDLVIPLTGDIYDLQWSPDGKEILFSYAPGGVGTSHSLYVVRADGRDGISPVTSSPSDDFGARWSPDGTKIAFVRGQLSGSVTSRSLYVMDPDGANLVKYVNGTSSGGASSLVNSVAWSPDGTELVYSQDVAVGSDDLFVIPSTLPTGVPDRITNDPGRDELPFWASKASYFLDVTKAGTGTGRVTSSPAGIDCAATCTAQFDDPQSVTLTATPDAGQLFTGWSGACTGTEDCTVSMLGDRAVTATFAGPPSPGHGGGGGGSSSFFITVDASKTQVKPGDLVDFTATIKNTSATAAQSLHAFIATPPGTLLSGPPLLQIGGGCINEVNAEGGLEQNCNLDYLPGGGSTTVRYELQMTTAGDYNLTVGVTARNQNPSNTTGYSGGVTVNVAADTSPPPPPPTSPPPPKTTKGVTKTGNARANTLLGTARDDVLRGLGGNDVLRGYGGNDVLLGGAGNDRLFGGAGNDQLLGGPGKDVMYGDAGNDTVFARDGQHDTIYCGPGRDIVYADKIDTVSRDCEIVRRK